MDEKGSSEKARLDIEKSVAKFAEIDFKLLFCQSAPLRVSDQDRTARLVIGTSRTRLFFGQRSLPTKAWRYFMYPRTKARRYFMYPLL